MGFQGRWASRHLCRNCLKKQRIVIYHINYVKIVIEKMQLFFEK